MKKSIIYWYSSTPKTKNVSVEYVDYFNARGMRRVYGRGDHFSRFRIFNMDIWLTSTGRLLMRCWSRSQDVDGRSFEIKGLDISKIPKPDKKKGLEDSWLPAVVRKTYNEWIEDEF